MKKFLLATLAPLFFGLSAHGAVPVTFSGGNGAPLSFTLASPVQFVVTATNANSPFFVFDGTGGAFGTTGTAVSGSISYTINGGGVLTLARLGSGRAANDVTADDAYLFSTALPGVNSGDTVTLTGGTLTTAASFAGAPPANGSFNSFISAQSGLRVSGFGTAVPEPGPAALMLLAGGGAAMMAFRRQRRAA